MLKTLRKTETQFNIDKIIVALLTIFFNKCKKYSSLDIFLKLISVLVTQKKNKEKESTTIYMN
jgi:hypothetical protein